MANYSYSTLTHARTFYITNSRLPALIAPALIALALLGLATPDPVISGRATVARGVAK